MAKLVQIEGIGEAYAERIKSTGIRSTDALLKRGSTSHGRKELAERSGIGEHLILEWVNRADLFRIKGIGEEYSDLLESAGVDSVVELAQRNAENLYPRLQAANRDRKLVRRMPGKGQVANWITQAKSLPRRVTH